MANIEIEQTFPISFNAILNSLVSPGLNNKSESCLVDIN